MIVNFISDPVLPSIQEAAPMPPTCTAPPIPHQLPKKTPTTPKRTAPQPPPRSPTSLPPLNLKKKVNKSSFDFFPKATTNPSYINQSEIEMDNLILSLNMDEKDNKATLGGSQKDSAINGSRDSVLYGTPPPPTPSPTLFDCVDEGAPSPSPPPSHYLDNRYSDTTPPMPDSPILKKSDVDAFIF